VTHAQGVLVAFDLGGVLVRICRDWPQGCRAAGVACGADPSVSDPATVQDLVSLHQRGMIPDHDFFEGLSRCTGAAVAAADARRVHQAWILGEYADVPQMLGEIVASGHRTACLSNTNALHWEQLQGMPFFQRLHHRHASHQMGLEKPDHRIFAAFQDRVNASGSGILYFDDLSPNVEAAAALGWRAHHVDPSRETVPQIRAALRSAGVLP
jgi:putative hydrolase of the HAD superfamily